MKYFVFILLLVTWSCASRDKVAELESEVARLNVKVTLLENSIDSLWIAMDQPTKKKSSEGALTKPLYSSPRTTSAKTNLLPNINQAISCIIYDARPLQSVALSVKDLLKLVVIIAGNIDY